MGNGQRVCAGAAVGGEPRPRCSVYLSDARLDLISFLLDTPVAALAAGLQDDPRASSQEYERRAVVRTFDASAGASAVLLIRADPLRCRRTPDPHSVSYAASGANRSDIAHRI